VPQDPTEHLLLWLFVASIEAPFCSSGVLEKVEAVLVEKNKQKEEDQKKQKQKKSNTLLPKWR